MKGKQTTCTGLDYVGGMMQCATFMFAICLLGIGEVTYFFVVIIPSLVLVYLSCFANKRDDFALFVFKGVVLVQTLIMSTVFLGDLYGSIDKSNLALLRKPPKFVKNHYSNGFVTEIEGRQNNRYVDGNNKKKHAASEEEYISGSSSSSLGTRVVADNHHVKVKVPRALLPPLTYNTSTELIRKVFGELPKSDFDDLRYRSSSEVQASLTTIFQELPKDAGFLPGYKNPCWFRNTGGKDPDTGIDEPALTPKLVCLPYVYLLGQPKCGTSDLYERLINHHLVTPPRRKEVRWFTRGEFSYDRLTENMKINSKTSIYSYTDSFQNKAVEAISMNPSKAITIDGGPHTLWWPTQEPDGSMAPDDIPPVQIVREMQPSAKFIITLCDPVRRMYSDYNFLGDDLKPVKAGPGNIYVYTST